MYFYKGWAIHGAANVPAYPASHGCVRISNADADWLFGQITIGTPVIVYDTTGKSPSVNNAPATAAPGY
jgi:lipoprotein-anchoring transpeptidase ErfK/SrfK